MARVGLAAPDLRIPGGRHEPLARKLVIERRAEEERIAGKMARPEAVVVSVVVEFGADYEGRRRPNRKRGGGAEYRLVHPDAVGRACRFRLVDQIDGAIELILDELRIRLQLGLEFKILYAFAARLVDAAIDRLEGNRHGDRRGGAVDQQISEFPEE